MILTVNPILFQKEFLTPILEINKEGKSAIFFEDNKLYSLSQSADHRVILYNTFIPAEITDPVKRINVNIPRLLKALNCVSKTESLISFTIEDNNLLYQDDIIKFNMKLLGDNLLKVPAVKAENIDKFPFTSQIYISDSTMKDIKRVLDFMVNADKFYIEKEDDCVYFYFGDKSADDRNLQDDMRLLISNQFHGEFNSTIFSTEILKFMAKSKTDILFKIGQNTMLSEITTDDSTLSYITTSIKK
jgi:hypothetical protein